MGNHSAGRHSRHASTDGSGRSAPQDRVRRQPDGSLPRQRTTPDAAARRQALTQARGERVRSTSATTRSVVRQPTVAVWGSQRLGQTIGMDTVTGPISESTTARVRQEDAARRVNRSGNRGGSHRAAPGRGSARTKIAVASTASIAGLSALVTGMTLSNPSGDANNGSAGPSVEAASLPGAFSAGAGQASRADRADEAPVTPQVPAAPSAYQGEEQPLPDPGTADYGSYGESYGTYDSYVPSTGDVVGESIPVFPLTDPTGQDGSQLPYTGTGGVPSTTGTTQPPGTQPGTTAPTATAPTATQPTTPAPTPSTGYPTTPSTTPPPSTTPTTPASPAPSGTALPFEPEDDDIVVEIPIFGLTPSGTSTS